MNEEEFLSCNDFQLTEDILKEIEKEEKIKIKKVFLNDVAIIKDFNKKSYELRNYSRFYRNNLLYGYMYQKYGFTFEEIKCIENITKAYYKRLKRCRNYIKYCFKIGYVYFITLTFKPSVLDNTCEYTRRKYVIRFLNKYFKFYVSNIDYGDKNEREHYHAIVCIPFEDMNKKQVKKYIDCAFVEWLNKNGRNEFKKTYKNDKDYKCLSSYINKLTNHAFKECTKNKRLIYSKYPFCRNELILISNIQYF